MLADADFHHVAPPAHALFDKMVQSLGTGGPHHSADRKPHLPALLPYHHGQVAVVAEAGIEAAQTMQYFRAKNPAHTRNNVKNIEMGLKYLCRRLERVFDFLKSSEQRLRAVIHLDIRGGDTDRWISEGQEPMLDGSVLEDRVGVDDCDELSARHADADVERTRLAVAPRRREYPHALRVPAAARHAESGAPGDGDAVVFRIVVDENDFEVRVAAEKRAANALPDRLRLVSSGDHDGNQRGRLVRQRRRRRADRGRIEEINQPDSDRREHQEGKRK